MAMSEIFVVGSVNQDIVVSSEKIPTPGETVVGKNLEFFPGGKGANQAVAAKLLGGKVSFVGKVGKDAFGEEMYKYLSGLALGANLLRDEESPTGTAIIIVDKDGENSITVVPGSNGTLSADECAILERGTPGDYLVLQNEIPMQTIEELLHRAKENGLTTVFNAAPAVILSTKSLNNLDVVIVNEHEFSVFFDCNDVVNERHRTEVAQLVRKMADRLSVGVILTLGANGVVASVGEEDGSVQGRRVVAVDTTGAGDCFVGAVVVGLSEGLSLRGALEFANTAASLSVTRMGASASFPRRADVENA
jgi:ribokinase